MWVVPRDEGAGVPPACEANQGWPAMSRVAVVTDSTAYLPPGVADKHDIGVVPLHVVLGLHSGAEGVEVSPADVAEALTERRVDVSTSRPTPTEFADAYRATG